MAQSVTQVGGFLAVFMLLQVAHSCVWLMGESRDSLIDHPAGVTEWNYALRGDNWVGNDASNTSWVCKDGRNQSPINLINFAGTTKSSPALKTMWSYTDLPSNGSNIQVYNNGHTIQVQWKGELQSNVKFVAKDTVLDVLTAMPGDPALNKFQMTPLQFHFHTTSEHATDGLYYPIEMHIVHIIPQSVLSGCPSSGCLSVTAMNLKISDTLNADNAFLKPIWEVMPEREGVVANMKAGAVLSIESLLPMKDWRAYQQYHGSLTTPPCSEGLLWHVFKVPMEISVAQYNQYAKAVGLKECYNKNTTGLRRSAQEVGAHDHAHHHAHHGHGHNHAAHERLAAFQRGAYTGFVPAHELGVAPSTTSRKMLEFNAGPTYTPDDYICKVVAFGITNRNLQPLNARKVLAFN